MTVRCVQIRHPIPPTLSVPHTISIQLHRRLEILEEGGHLGTVLQVRCDHAALLIDACLFVIPIICLQQASGPRWVISFGGMRTVTLREQVRQPPGLLWATTDSALVAPVGTGTATGSAGTGPGPGPGTTCARIACGFGRPRSCACARSLACSNPYLLACGSGWLRLCRWSGT